MTKVAGSMLLLLCCVLTAQNAAAAESIHITLQAGPYEIISDQDGFDRVDIDGFSLQALPGEPLLPAREFKILLPPDTNFSTVKLTATPQGGGTLSGLFDIRPAAPDQAGANGVRLTDWGGATNIENGKNMDVYGVDALFPASQLQRGPKAAMRKYRFVRFTFYPMSYNPVSRQLVYTPTVEVDIEFERGMDTASTVTLRDKGFEDEAATLFDNYDQAKQWYETQAEFDQPLAPSYDLLIVTTNAIESGSSKLADFVTFKRKSMTVMVITEDEYGGASGTERADKIRNWLKSNYVGLGIEYVLLIGNPTPGGTGVDAVPMKTCEPAGGSYPTPTDFYFSELSGDFDGDNDGIYGEWDDYNTYSDPDLVPKVKVGRIPVYGSNYTNLDAILQKTINYQNAFPTAMAWRKKALLPMSFSSSGYDGAPLAQQMWDDYLNSADWSRYRLYQQGTGTCSACNSAYTSDEDLLSNKVRDHWQNNNYGVVCWWGHGSQTTAAIGYDGCWDGTLFSSSQASDVNNAYPAVAFLNSCTNGYPETSSNLGYSLLLNGAVGTYSASRVSWFNTGVGYGQFDGSSTNSGLAYEVTKRVVAENTQGTALALGKTAVLGNIIYDTRLMNQYDFNLYGDPTVSIADVGTRGLPIGALLPLILNTP